jgi:hypothetical protein
MTILKSYQAARDSLLETVTEIFSKDERMVAGWLTGSLGRNEADLLSDIDITLVVRNQDSVILCARNEPTSAETSPERHTLFSQFAKPALVHENNNNAPQGGTFTCIMYSESALMVDWTLVPQEGATRPFQSKLLFDKTGIPVLPPPEPEEIDQSIKSVAETWAFFWMMTAVTIKYIIRGDGVFAAQWIENLTGMVNEIERLLNQEPWTYMRDSQSKLQPTAEKQIESIRELCNRIQELRPRVKEFTRSEPCMPLVEIETLLSLANK